ncbi:MAG: ABC transporter substrate-binding protein [Proteobacteria bacterium]|nr:ABC transporter substrate-binding protein [Pseudomonadota bacterium]
MTRRFFLSTVVGLWIGLRNFAVAAVQPGVASELIRRLGEQAIAALGAPGASLEAREARFRSLLSESFDLAFIGRFVLGRYWRQATPEQRSDYLALFGEYVLQTYSARLGGYAGESMTILSERPAGTKDVVVSTRILRPSGPPIEAAWRVRTTGARYRIIDIMVEGVSMVVTQRSEFAAVVQRHGIQGLIEVLRARTTKLPAVAASK